ncbi:MAG: hypothetical protein QM778_11945 [Myxococcales bacterium]
MNRALWLPWLAVIFGCSTSDPEDRGHVDAGSDTVCASVKCDAHAECFEQDGAGTCRCKPGYSGDGSTCTAVVDPCIAAGTCPEGVWVRHVLPGIASIDTVQSVVGDPVRPSDFYAFVGSNSGPTIKVYASTDFGETWENRNVTAELTGNPWGASIDPNPKRDPSTAPTLWSPSGYGAGGAWRSTDGGRTWQRSEACDTAFKPYSPFGGTDLYHVQILPDDPPNHVLATYHYYFRDNSEGGFGETWDGGQTWVVHPPPVGVGTSHYVVPVDATTWVVIAQDNNGQNGIWRTTTAGRTGGSAAKKFRDGTIDAAAWQKVDTLEHAHGSHQNVRLPDGSLLVTGWVNGAVSRDMGATWQHFSENGSWAPPHQFEQANMTNIAVTERFAYTNFLANPTLARAPLNALVGAANWDVEYCERPANYTVGGGPFGMASSYNADASRWVVIAGSLDGSIWKYVEPPP